MSLDELAPKYQLISDAHVAYLGRSCTTLRGQEAHGHSGCP